MGVGKIAILFISTKRSIIKLETFFHSLISPLSLYEAFLVDVSAKRDSEEKGKENLISNGTTNLMNSPLLYGTIQSAGAMICTMHRKPG